MAFYSVADMIREVRKPGKIEADVNSEHDAYCMLIEKSDLLDKLRGMDANGESPWCLRDVGHPDGTRRLTVISDYDRSNLSVAEVTSC